MTDTLVGVSRLRKAGKKTLTPEEAQRAAVRELVEAARARVRTWPARTGC